MAEGENYMTGVNAARQRIRSSRRQRGSDVIDSLESAAEMDRMRGVDVGSSGFTGVTDTPAINVVGAVASGGGTKAPITTTGGVFQNMRRGSGYAVPRSTVSQGGCANGRCGIPRSTTVVSEPMFSIPSQGTTVTSRPAVSTTVTPQATSSPVVTSVEPQSEAARLRGAATSAMDAASGLMSGYPAQSTRVLAAGAETALAAANNSVAEKIADAEIAGEQAAAELAGRVAASTINKTNQEAGMIRAATPDGYDEDQTQYLADAVLRGKTPGQYAAARLAQDKLTVSVGQKDNVVSSGGVDPTSEPSRYMQYLQQGFAAHGVHLLITSQQAYARSQEALYVKGTPSLSRDPVTGKPLELHGPEKKAEPFQNQDRAIRAIVSGLKEGGLMGPGSDWSDIDAALTSLVFAPMNQFNRQLWLERNAADLQTYPEADREDLRQSIIRQADAHTELFVDAIRSQVEVENLRMQGSGMTDPDAGQMVRAWGGAPPMTSSEAK
jgi:hypothetical protein